MPGPPDAEGAPVVVEEGIEPTVEVTAVVEVGAGAVPGMHWE